MGNVSQMEATINLYVNAALHFLFLSSSASVKENGNGFFALFWGPLKVNLNATIGFRSVFA